MLSGAYARVQTEVEVTLAAIKCGKAYLDAPMDERDTVVAKVFGPGRVCDYPPIALPSVSSLLDAAGRHSLTSLDQGMVALPGYNVQVEAGLRELSAPPPLAEERVYEWRPVNLLGVVLSTRRKSTRRSGRSATRSRSGSAMGLRSW